MLAERAGAVVTAVETVHMSPPWIGLAYRITADGRTIAVSGDTGPAMDLASLCRDSDLFVCECTNPEPTYAEHMDVATLATLRPSWNARRVVLTHLTTAARELAAALPGVEVAADGMTVTL